MAPSLHAWPMRRTASVVATAVVMMITGNAATASTPTSVSPASAAPASNASVAAASAATASAAALNLATAYDLALSNDAQLRAARAAAQAARERLPQARAQFRPLISAQVTRSRNDLETTQPNALGQETTSRSLYNSESEALQLRQPIYRRQLQVQLRQAGFQVEDAEAQLQRESQNLVTRLAQAYFDVLLAGEQLEVVRLQQQTYTVAVDGATKALAAGTGTRTDIDEARARLDLANAQELEVRQNLDLARRQLQLLVNQPVTQVAGVDVARLPMTPPSPASVEAWVQRAEEGSAELRSARAQLELARQEVQKAQSGHYPTLDATAQISRSSSEQVTRIGTTYNQRSIGVQLNIPLYQGGFVDSQVREALAQQERAENALEAIRRDLGVRVHREFRGATEGVERVRALQQAVRSAEQLVQSSKRSFEAGVRTRLDILNAEQQLGVARRDLAQARYTYLVSLVRLRALAGEPMDANITEVNAWLRR